jgi:prepilin-type processing-associated H-X9-DG protein
MSAGTSGGFNCPFCGQYYSLTAEQVPQYAGQAIACTVCKRQFTVPLQLAASMGAAQPAAAQYAQQGFAPPVGFEAEGQAPIAQHPAAWAQPAYASPMVSPPSSGLAIAALICGLLFFIPILPAILAVIFGIIGINQTRGGRAGGRGLAVAGLVCGAASLFFWGSCFLAPLAGFNRAVRQAQQTAKQVQCSSNLQQIGAGLALYASNNNGKYPAKLAALLDLGFVSSSVFVCPHSGDTPAPGGTPKAQASNLEKGGHLSYMYVGQKLDENSPDDAVMVYEKLGNHGNQGTNVLFKDGHVEWYDATKTATLMSELGAGHNPPQKAAGEE